MAGHTLDLVFLIRKEDLDVRDFLCGRWISNALGECPFGTSIAESLVVFFLVQYFNRKTSAPAYIKTFLLNISELLCYQPFYLGKLEKYELIFELPVG